MTDPVAKPRPCFLESREAQLFSDQYNFSHLARINMSRSRCWTACLSVLALGLLGATRLTAAEEPLIMVVMDPLAKELSCPCVQGYAQRDYKQLGKFLEQKLKQPVKVVFMESLKEGLEREGLQGADLIIGKHSVVLAQSAALKMSAEPLMALTGKTGKTTQQGFIVVASGDPASGVADLAHHEVIFGSADCDEKYAAAVKLFEKAQMKLPEKLETCASCSDGATKIVEAGPDGRIAAVISSYAAPLLEGCGTVKKGDLKVIAKTKPVPFITAFSAPRVSEKTRRALEQALLEVADRAALCEALETLNGFVEIKENATGEDDSADDQAGKPSANAADWTGWRGPLRDARVTWLPDRLPEKAKWLWKKRLPSPGLGGLAATGKYLIASGREAGDTADFFGA
jgi:ABC-type phosphate/phosphonate transport system substrate-binding protein